jgi:hypothetical protein
MQNFALRSFILGCLCSTTVIGGLLSLRPAPAEAQAPRQKWEATWFNIGDPDLAAKLGNEGWEPYAATDRLHFFKRRK